MTALMVWKCVHDVAPAYLSDLCVPATAISGRQHLRAAATGTLLVLCARTATGQRSFAVNGPATLNRLSPALRSPDLSESAFKRALKTPILDCLAPLILHDSGAEYKYPDLLTYLPITVLVYNGLLLCGFIMVIKGLNNKSLLGGVRHEV